MESLIPVINKLQDVFATIGNNDIHLPQIVVVGSQSSGKSSVIEGFVGRDFLPRGTGIVTRRPLLLQLTYMPMNDPKRLQDPRFKNGDWATFDHKPGEVFTDFQKVRGEIQAETDRETGTNKGISIVPINLKIYSANVVDLTLIDLPGIVKVAIGDQPPDIEARVTEMIKGYIKDENTIILAVTPAIDDLATSESLKFALDVDPNGDRTLCVLTKLDIMDRGVDAMEVLSGKLKHVKLGIIGVVNRSQEDLNLNKSVGECLEAEVEFLKKKYPTIAAKNGIQYLAKTLNKLLMNHIHKCLPDLKVRVGTLMTKCAETLQAYGDPIDESEKSKIFLQMLINFSTAYISTIDGIGGNIKDAKLFGGARICHVFYEVFGKQIEGIVPLDGLNEKIILTVIRNVNGTRPAFFISEVSFELLVKEQILGLDEPCFKCVDLVYKELLHMVQKCDNQKEMQRFPHAFEKIKEFISKFLHSRISPTKEVIKNLLEIQQAHINTVHPDFLLAVANDTELIKTNNGWVINEKPDENAPFVPFPTTVSDENYELTPREKHAANVFQRLIFHYFTVVRKSVQDMVPKAVMNFLVNYLRKNLQTELLDSLHKSFNELLVESENIAKQREETAEMLETLNRANSILSEVHETDIY